MSILIDLFGSILICAVLAVSVSRMNDLLLTRTHQRSGELMTEATARSVVYALEHDLRKVGYGVSGTPFSLADSTRVRFYADVDADGSVDTLFYYVGSIGEAADTPNPADRYLYRVVNGEPHVGGRVGITSWQFTYFDAAGNPSLAPADLGQIRKVRVEAEFAGLSAYDNVYAQTRIHLAVRPRNLGL